MTTKGAKKGAPTPSSIRIGAIVPAIAALDIRRNDTTRTAENRTRTRIRDAINRGELKTDASGKAVLADSFWEFALRAWGPQVRQLPGCPQSRTIIEDVVSSGSVNASVTDLDRAWRPDDHDWLRRHYPVVSAANEALSAEVQELRDRLARFEGESEKRRLQEREGPSNRGGANKKGGRPATRKLRS